MQPVDAEIEPDDEDAAAVEAAKFIRAERRMRHWFAKLVRKPQLYTPTLDSNTGRVVCGAC